MFLRSREDCEPQWVSESDAWVEELLPRSLVSNQGLAIHRGRVQPGGKVVLHTHTDEEQAYYILEGKGRIRIGQEQEEVTEGTVVFIPMNLENEMWNTGEEELEYLFISYWPSTEDCIIK